MANEFIIKNGYFSQGSSNVTGSLTVTAGVTASLQGTASWSNNAITASYIATSQTASYVLNAVSASFSSTSSFLNSSTNGFIQGGNSFGTAAIIGTNDTQNLNIETAGSTRVFVSSSGQVGIGTTTPRETLGITGTGMRLEVGAFSEAGTVKMTSFHSTLYLASNLYYSGSTQPETNSYYILDSGSNNRGGNLFYIKTNGAGGATPSSGFFFYTAPTSSGANTLATLTENFRITPGTASFSNNIVGIGTTTPTAKLHVNNTGTVNSLLVEDSANPDATPFVIDASGNVGIGTTTPISKLTVSASGVDGILIGADASTGNQERSGRLLFGQQNPARSTSIFASSGSMFFSTLASASVSSGTARMVITDSGSVGIGTTNPSALLHINNTTAGNSLLVEDSTNPDATPFVIDASGNVGIGTTTPSVKLHVSGGPAILRLEGTDHMFQEFYPQSGGTRFGYLGYGVSGSTDLRLFNQPIGGRILFATENLTRMSIQANGNVGVGVSLPTEVNAKFHVNNTSTSASFLVEDSTNPDATPFIIDNTGKVVIGGLSPYLGVAEFTLTGSAGVITAGQGGADIATIAAISSVPSSYSLIGVDNSTAIGGVGLRSYGSSSADTLFGYSASSSIAVLGFPITNANMFVGTTDSRTVVLGAGKELIRLRGAAAIPYVDITGSVIVTGSLTVSGSSTFTNIGPANFTGSLGVTGSTNLIGGVNVHNKYYFINTLNDLPTPSSGVITLADNVTYFFTTTVDLNGNRLVCGRNTTILGGSSENSRIKSTGLTGTPLISSSYSIPMRGITIEADVALHLDASGSNEAIDWFGVNFTSCPTVGLIKNYSNVIMTDCAFLESANCTFDGTIGTVGFVTCLFNGRSGQTIMSVTPTGSITRRFRPIYSSFIALSGETALSVPTSSIVNAEGFILDTCNFSGGGTYISGANTGSLKSLFVNNVGIPNTTNVGHYYMINNTTNTTIGVPNVNVWVKAAGTTTIGIGNSPKWVGNGSNRIDYSGSISQDFKFTAVGTVQSAVVNQVMSVGVAKNGTIQDESEVTIRTATANQPYPFAVQDLVQVAAGDYVEVFVRNTTSTDIRVGDLNVIIDKIGS